MEAYLGAIHMFAGNYAPRGWQLCQGQLLPISQYGSLFSLLGTTYGGDGRTTFGLPDLRGRLPVGTGNGIGLTPRSAGQMFGTETVTLTEAQMPGHTHAAYGSGSDATSLDPGNAVVAVTPGVEMYGNGATPTDMAPESVGQTGGNDAHSNMQPYLCINFIICTEQGVIPSRN